MESTQIPNINFLVWAENEEEAHALGKLVTGVTIEDGVFSKETTDAKISAYPRWPKCSGGKAPADGIIDCIFLKLSSDKEEVTAPAKEYVNLRKGIPFKYSICPNDLTEWGKSLDIIYWGAEANDDLIKKSVKGAIDLDNTLKKTFNLFDVDKSGWISQDNLLKVSKDLGHELNTEEAKDISKTISDDEGKIRYPRFKYWWLAGRANFSQFRNLVEMEMSMNNLVKKSSGIIGHYLEKVNQEISSTKGLGDGICSRMNIKPKKDFENGISIGANVTAGNEAKILIDSLPDYFMSSQFTYSLELHLKNPDLGPTAIEQLEQAKQMILTLAPGIQQAFDMGLTVKFRSADKSVFVDVALAGMLGEMVSQQMNAFNIENANFSGYSSVRLISGIKLGRPFEVSFDEMIEMLTQFKVESHGEISNLKPMLHLIINSLSTVYQHNIPSKMKPLLKLIKIFGAMRKFEYTLDYDSEELCKLAKELIGCFVHSQMGGAEWNQVNSEMGIQMVGGIIAQGQGQGKGVLDGVKMTALGFLAPFLDTLKGLNFDRIGFNFCSPKFTLFYNVSINLVGLTEFLNKNIFESSTEQKEES